MNKKSKKQFNTYKALVIIILLSPLFFVFKMDQRRALGYQEKFFKLVHDKLHGCTTTTSVFKVCGPLNYPLVIKALKLMHKRHPLLHASIKQDQNEFYFDFKNHFADIPLKIISSPKKHFWRQAVEDELNKPFPINKYLWRGSLINHYTHKENHRFMFTFHRSIADGPAIVNFVQEFLSTYAALVKGETPNLKSLSLQPPVDSFLQEYSSDEFPAVDSDHAHERNASVWPYQSFARLSKRRTRNIYKKLHNIDLKKLIDRCHAEKTTVNAALNAALLLAASKIKNKPVNIPLSTAVNLRRYCDPKISYEHFGAYNTVLNTYHENISADMPFWNVARDYNKNLKGKINNQGLLSLTNYNADLKKMFNIGDDQKYFYGGFASTNRGKLSIPRWYGPLKLKSFYFCTSRNAGYHISVLHVQSVHGKMYLCFNYTEPLLKQEWMEKFVDEYMNILKKNI